MLTWIHDCLGPHVLHSVSTPFHPLVVVDRTGAVVIGLMLGLDLAIVDVVHQLKILQKLLHLLL